VAVRRSFRILNLIKPSDSTEVDPEVNRNFPRNFLVNVLDLTFFGFGESFANPRTILPVFASTLTSSPFVIGLIPILNDIGWSLPQIFFTRFTARLPRKLPAILLIGIAERLPFLLLGLLALKLTAVSTQTAVALLLVFVSIRAFSAGIIGVPWQEMLASVIPPGRRGSFFGTGFLMGQLSGIAASSVVAYLLATMVYPQGYTYSFFLAFAGVSISWFFTAMTKEPVVAPEKLAAPADSSFGLQGSREILRSNRNFRRYLVSRGLYVFGFTAMAYLAVYALQTFQLSAQYAGIFSGVMLGGALLGNIIGGALSDRYGSKATLLFASLTWAAALLTALLAPTWEAFLLVFAILGMSNSANTVGDLSIAMDFSTGVERPVYVGTARTVAGLITIPTPFIAGLLVQSGGYKVMMAACLAFTLLSILVLWRMVQEPRPVRAAVQG